MNWFRTLQFGVQHLVVGHDRGERAGPVGAHRIRRHAETGSHPEPAGVEAVRRRQLLAVLAHQARTVAGGGRLQHTGAGHAADQQRARLRQVTVEARHSHVGVLQRGERDGLAARPIARQHP